MAESAMSDADKIRAKRLAKLGGSQSTGGPSSQSSKTEPAPDPTQPPRAPNYSIEQPTEKLQDSSRDVNTATDGLHIPSASPVNLAAPSRTSSPAKRQRDEAQKPRARYAEQSDEFLEDWEDKTLKQVLRATLDPSENKDVHGNPMIFLKSLSEDTMEANASKEAPSRLRLDLLEVALAEAAAIAPTDAPLEYLLSCFKRTSRLLRSVRFHGSEDPRQEVLKETRRLCMSYCVFAATMPEMFRNSSQSNANPLVEHLLAEPESDRGICTDFLTEASSRFEEDGSIRDAIVEAAEELSQQLSSKSMLDDYQAYVRGLRNLIRFPKIVTAITESPMFLPEAIEAQDIEQNTLLGPFFRLSPMQLPVAQSFFSAPKTRDRAYIANAQNAVRLTLRTHQLELFQITDTIVRTGPAPRERLLNWLALCVNSNHKKRAMRPDARVVSSDGFMVNITHILDQLCEPFMDAKFGKIDRIDPDYLRRNPRVIIAEETKINADQKAADEFYAQTLDGSSNFISELFFLTVAAHHYGTEAAQTQMTSTRKSVQRMEKDLVQFEGERVKYAANPAYLVRFEEHVNRIKKQIDDMWSSIHSTYGVLVDDLNQARSMQFMRYVIVWLLRIASQQALPSESLRLPLPTEQRQAFRFLPEYFLEDIVDNFKFITRNLPRIITPQQSHEIVQVCIAFLRSSDYIKNPGIKSGLVTILFYGCQPSPGNPRGILGDQLLGSTFANQHLLHALLRFYIEAESTGTHTQFFDKFNIRFEIFQVIKAIWTNTLYRENLAKEAQVNTEFFVRFVNFLVNDVTFVLDESLSSFAKIHELSKEVADTATMASLSEEQRKEKTDLLEDHKGRAKSYMQLTKETMEMLILFSESLPESFTMPEIVTRLADMLDYNLDTMVGPKQSNLKVESPQEYGFNPRQLLADIVTVYCNLSEKQNFINAIARDGRSYKPANFAQASEKMKRFVLKSPEELSKWDRLAVNVAAAKEAEEAEEADLGEVPDEFMDPLVFDLMSDPVILPISKSVIDRSTIRSHLLSDPTDPFNRSPLKIEDVVPDTELKAKIEAWKAERKAARAAERAEKMDTGAG